MRQPISGLLATRIARRRAAAYGVLLALCLLLIGASGSAPVLELQRGVAFAFRPILGGLDGVVRTAGSVVGALTEIDQLRVENGALRAENERLRNENILAQEARRENEILTGLLQLRSGLDFKTIGAVVIARDSSEFRRVVVIDRGTDDGLTVGDVVVAAGGALAGRVVDAGPSSARVALISDAKSTVIGMAEPSAATGEVRGQLGGTLIMENVDSTLQVGVGQEVVTAGIELAGGIRSPYPKGLLIGQVVDVTRNANEIVQTLYLEPAATLDRLEYVLVILDYAGGLPAADEGPIPCGPSASGTLPDSEQPCTTGAPTPRPSPTR